MNDKVELKTYEWVEDGVRYRAHRVGGALVGDGMMQLIERMIKDEVIKSYRLLSKEEIQKLENE